jgi:hypothetical protein
MPKFDITVEVPFGENAFAIMAEVQRAIKNAGATPEQVKEYFDQSTSGDYSHLCAVAEEWVNVA